MTSVPLKLLYTPGAVIIDIVGVVVPYMVLTLSAVIEGISRQTEEAAANLGAKPLTVFRRILLPLAAPGVVAGSVLVFILCMNAYATPVLLGGPQFQMMAPGRLRPVQPGQQLALRRGAAAIRGTSGNDTISGTSWNDTIAGGAGNDTMSGGTGSDTFVFRANLGQDVVTDFTVGSGLLEFQDGNFADAAAAFAAATSSGSDTLITIDANNTVLLKNVSLANLHEADFHIM